MSIAGDTYGLGAALGLASYFGSVGNEGNFQSSVGFARQYAVALENVGIPVNQPDDPLNNSALNGSQGYPTIETVRQTYSTRLKDRGHLQEIYGFGLALGVAEGELSAGSLKADVVAHEWLKGALGLSELLKRAFPFVVPNPPFTVNSPYSTITALRQSFQTDFNNSSGM